MTTTVLRLWSIGRPIPRGWRIAPHRLSHHSVHSVLLERIPTRSRRVKRSSVAAAAKAG